MTSITQISWTPSKSAKEAASHGLFAGKQSDGKRVYVGKVKDANGNFVVSKIVPEENKAFFLDNGTEKAVDQMEYLFHNEGYEWIRSSNGANVPDAVILSDNYVGRAEIDGTTIIGKVDLKTKQLTASLYGKPVNLKEYDVLVFKPQVVSAVNGHSKSVKITKTESESTVSRKVVSNVSNGSMRIIDDGFGTTADYIQMKRRIADLEFELSNYKNDRISYEQRILQEQELNKSLRSDIVKLTSERTTLIFQSSVNEKRVKDESMLLEDLKRELEVFRTENSHLLGRVSTLEKDLKSEKYQYELFVKHMKDSGTSASNNVISDYEEKLKIQEQTIREWERKFQNTQVNTDSRLSQLKSYERTVEYQKIQIDGLLKKLENANADNDFLVKKLQIITQSFKKYKNEIEIMRNQLQNAKGMIASLTNELAKAHTQLSKFQAALSKAYIINGELMTKITSSASFLQYESKFDSKYDILNVNLNSIESDSKSFVYNTPGLYEATDSETFKEFMSSSSSTLTSSGSVSAAAASARSYSEETKASSDTKYENGVVEIMPL